MDFGDDVSHTMTIYEGYALLHAVLRWNNSHRFAERFRCVEFFASQVSLTIGFSRFVRNGVVVLDGTAESCSLNEQSLLE